jgi:hypothetical protein
MSQGQRDRIDASHFSQDIREFLRLLHTHYVRYVIAGGEAVIYYGHVRLTGDIDIFYDRREENAQRLFQALSEFWGGNIPGISEIEELAAAGLILQFGRPPNRIDLLNRIDGVTFEDAWSARREVLLASGKEAVPVSYIGPEPPMANKKAAGRPKDQEDLTYLRQITRPGTG